MRLFARILAFLALASVLGVGVLPTVAVAQVTQVASFSPTIGTGLSLSVSSSSSRVAFTSAGPTAFITNTGSNSAYVKFGGSTVTATTSNWLIAPGCSVAWDVNGQPYVAAITASSTTTLTVITGSGLPTLPQSGCSATSIPSGVQTTTSNAWVAVAATQRGLSIAAATAPTVPATATILIIEAQGTNGTGGACLYWQDDGTNPTNAAGQGLVAFQSLIYKVSSTPIKLIAASGATCTATISYYKDAP